MAFEYELIYNKIFEVNKERNRDQYIDLQETYSISISKNIYNRTNHHLDIRIYQIFRKLSNE